MTRATPQRQPLAEAAAWHLLGLMLQRPRNGWHGEVRALAGELDDPEIHEAAGMSAQAREEGYLRLLGPGGLVSPREVAYRDKADFGRVLSDIAGFHEAFAYRPRAEDPLDHIAIETDFIGYLLLKLDYARKSGDRASEETTCRALADFARAHLDGFAAPLAERLASASSGYLARAARIVAAKAADITG